MAEHNINFEALQTALLAIRSLRSTVLDVFRTVGDGAPIPEDEEEREKFTDEMKGTLNIVKTRLRELETACAHLGSPPIPLNLGNTGILSQDPSYEKSSLYTELNRAHRWFDLMVEHSTHACAILSQNSLKRTNFNPSSSNPKQRYQTSGHDASLQTVDAAIGNLCRLFPDMHIKVVRPCGAPAVLLITLGKTMKSVITMRGMMIEWVVVRGYNEDFYDEYGKLDMWSGSCYDVFKKVSDNANAAMLHFYSPHVPDIALKSFVTWLNSYVSLFTAPCQKCGNRLLDNMPPTWRDVRNLGAYHESCKP